MGRTHVSIDALRAAHGVWTVSNFAGAVVAIFADTACVVAGTAMGSVRCEIYALSVTILISTIAGTLTGVTVFYWWACVVASTTMLVVRQQVDTCGVAPNLPIWTIAAFTHATTIPATNDTEYQWW